MVQDGTVLSECFESSADKHLTSPGRACYARGEIVRSAESSLFRLARHVPASGAWQTTLSRHVTDASGATLQFLGSYHTMTVTVTVTVTSELPLHCLHCSLVVGHFRLHARSRSPVPVSLYCLNNATRDSIFAAPVPYMSTTLHPAGAFPWLADLRAKVSEAYYHSLRDPFSTSELLAISCNRPKSGLQHRSSCRRLTS